MSKKAMGGKTVYGASVGILMLEARFPRIFGDVGNAQTFDFPVHYRVVPGASPDQVVRNRADGLLDVFIEAGHDLIRHGVDGIATNCGFLALYQEELAEALQVPVATSSMMQYGMIRQILPASKSIGILTVSSSTLSDDHLIGAGVPTDTTVVGLDEIGREFTRVLIDNELELDVDVAEQELVEAGNLLIQKDSNVGAILLECTNMPPYSDKIAAATGLPVFDMYSFICWFQAALSPRRFR